jgi:hypothetical protein
MDQRKIRVLTPVGSLALAAGILVRLFTHTNVSEFAGGFLIGISLVLLIAGLVLRKRAVSR